MTYLIHICHKVYAERKKNNKVTKIKPQNFVKDEEVSEPEFPVEAPAPKTETWELRDDETD